MRTGAFTLWLCFVMVAVARADDGIVLFERAGLRPGLCAALRIQLTASAQVRCEREPANGSLSERIARGAERVRGTQTRLGVLLEPDPDSTRIRMYILAAQEDQAVLAIERIENRPEPDVDRSLALKVADAYEIVAVVQRVAPENQGQALTAAGVAKGASEPSPAPSTPDVTSFLEAGGGIASAGGARAISKLWVGAAWLRTGFAVEVSAGVRLVSRRRERNEAGRVSLSERGPVASWRVLMVEDRFAIGAALEAGLSFVSAEGIAPDGSRGARMVLLPTLALQVDARVQVTRAVALRFAPGLELLTIDRQYGVDETVVVDDGPLRISATLSLLVDLPFRSRENLQP